MNMVFWGPEPGLKQNFFIFNYWFNKNYSDTYFRVLYGYKLNTGCKKTLKVLNFKGF
jgi:hypothetical protein